MCTIFATLFYLSRNFQEYRAGTLLTGQLKARCIGDLQKFVSEFQERRNKVTEADVDAFMSSDRKIAPTMGKCQTSPASAAPTTK
jgi:tryptophanyl-tRNA synthetase